MKLTDDDFTLFALQRQQRQDVSAIDARWRELQAEVHPDRFVSEGAAAQRVAMQWATRINQARQRLKDPLTRAAYLCELGGVPIEAERNTAMPAAFLVQQMNWREALDDAVDLAAVQALEADVRGMERQALAELDVQLTAQADDVALTTAAAQVRALMFVRRFREDLARRLEALETP